jgi:2'-5' RNA ligase
MAEPSRSTLFFALPVPAEVRALAGRCQEAVRRTLGTGRFPALEGLHVTLAFLGPTDPARVPALLGMAAEAAGDGPGFPLRTAGIGGFPRPERARILWLGFAAQPALAALAERLQRNLRAGGFTFDGKPFLPHLTLARFREPLDLGRISWPVLESAAFEVQGISLFQSVPTSQGMRYRLLGAV